jgi:hypothetical protein
MAHILCPPFFGTQPRIPSPLGRRSLPCPRSLDPQQKPNTSNFKFTKRKEINSTILPQKPITPAASNPPPQTPDLQESSHDILSLVFP